MKLYYVPGACSLAPHLVLRELGLPFELEKVDGKTGRTEKGTDYRTVNPKGTVPVLELDDGQRLGECAVVVQYLADRKPEAGLMPSAGTWERYRAQEWLNYVATELHKRFGPLFGTKAPPEWKAVLREQLAAQLEYVAAALGDRPYLLGAQPTAPDLYLFVVLSWGRPVNVDLARWPVLKDYWKRIAARPSVQAAWKAEGLK
jgi:glutathione S-transferase